MTNRKHSHYFKPVPTGVAHIDVYRVLSMFGVTDPCLQHAVKKLLVAGGRGGGKDERKDIQEAIDTLQRRLEMLDEDAAVEKAAPEQPWLDWWPGLVRPESGVFVDVRHRDGTTLLNVDAGNVVWRHCDTGYDIIAYREHRNGG